MPRTDVPVTALSEDPIDSYSSAAEQIMKPRPDVDPDQPCEVVTVQVRDGRWDTVCTAHQCPSGQLADTSEDAAAEFLCDQGSRAVFVVQQTNDSPAVVSPSEMHYLVRAVVAEALDADDDRFHIDTDANPWGWGTLAVAHLDPATGQQIPLTVTYCADPHNDKRVRILLDVERPGSLYYSGGVLHGDTTRILAAAHRPAVVPDRAGIYLATWADFHQAPQMNYWPHRCG